MAAPSSHRSAERDGPQPPSRSGVIGGGVTWLSRWTLRWLIIAGGAVLLGLIIDQLWSILLPLLLALIVTTILQPPAAWLERKLNLPAAAAAIGTIVGALLLLAAIVVFIAPSIGNQVGEIATSASDGLTKIQDKVVNSDLGITQGQVETAINSAQDRLRSSAATIASGVLAGASAITGALIDLLLVIVLTFFFIKDGRRFLPWLRNATGPSVGIHLTEVLNRSWTTVGGFIRTQALVGLIDAVLIGLGLIVVGVPLALPLAVLTFFGAFAPIVGAVTVGALAVLVALVSNGVVAALIILAVVLVVQQLEGNVLLPYLQGKSLRLHATVVLLGVVLGSTLFGVAGAFLAIPVIAVVADVLRYLDEVIRTKTDPEDAPDPLKSA